MSRKHVTILITCHHGPHWQEVAGAGGGVLLAGRSAGYITSPHTCHHPDPPPADGPHQLVAVAAVQTISTIPAYLYAYICNII